MPLFPDKNKSVNSSHDSRSMRTDRQPAQQPPRKEVLQAIDKMIKKHQADLEYLKDK
jgi:hypothetical protein